MELEIKKATRRALPLQIGLFGPSGSGKTFSALELAAGLSPNKKVCVIDSERGRASLYADNKKILAALPNGFDVIELDAPYHPERYIQAIDLCESHGYEVCIIDSGSDSWDGPGGCTDIAEKASGMWNRAKLWNKRMMTRAALSNMHILWCLKAQDKTKVIDKAKSASGKQEFLDMGMIPIWEKNNLFPLLLVFSVDPKTHVSTVTKCHDDLWELFAQPKLITKEDGEKVRKWNEGGKKLEEFEQLRKQARTAAEQGTQRYREFWSGLTAAQRKGMADQHEENKFIAEQADKPSDEPKYGEQADGTLIVPKEHSC